MRLVTIFAAAVMLVSIAHADVAVVVDHNETDDATAGFHFEHVPAPSKSDAATTAKFSIVDGARDPQGGDLEKLNDGQLPDEQDQPRDNFFFDAGTDGGRLQIDLGKTIEVRQINTYSWHPDTRGPQVYKLYAADGQAQGFNATPKTGTDPAKVGWKLLASVDTRPKDADKREQGGGQYGVSISDSVGGVLGKFRYVLMDISCTEDSDDYGNTFYSEIDVIDASAPAPTTEQADAGPILIEGKYVTIDVTPAPDLKDWCQGTLLPVCEKWYPMIVQMLPSEGYIAPQHFKIRFRSMPRGIPAATGGTGISCNIAWFRRNLHGEAAGAVVHEMVHVVQQYGEARRTNPNPSRNPGWMVEGIADYIRWFKYEPQTHGADIHNPANAKYDASYRVTANFLNWVTEKQDKDLVMKMNAAMRQGKYSDDLWKQYTGKTAEELGAEWKQHLSANQGAVGAAK